MTVADLFSHVYGPYPDDIFLKDDFPLPRLGIKLPLEDLELYCGSQRIGFDQSEYITNPPLGSPLAKNSTVTFFGILEIHDPDWISDKGLEYLERDFKEHDQKIHISHLTGTPGWSGIHKLSRQMKTERKYLKIRVGCTKNLLAHYLTTDNDFDKLLIYSQHQNIRRTYWVKSLNVQTFSLSQQFLDRYRLRALIVELCENDPDKTPVRERNIDFLIRRYFIDVRPRDRAGERRIIASPDLDASVSYEDRHLRHVSRSEIRSRFAAQAEWLLANQIASNGPNTKLLDITQWISFCKEAWSDSLAAQKCGAKWGLCRHQEINVKSTANDLSQRLAVFGQTAAFWAQQLKNVTQQDSRSTNKRTRTLADVAPSKDHSPMAAPVYHYDSDFSEATTAADPESDSEPFLNLGNSILRFVYEPPKLPSGCFIWRCPDCKWAINLLDIPPNCILLLPSQTVHIMKHTKSWKASDAPIQEALQIIVSSHITEDHLPEGFHFVTKANGNVWLSRSQETGQQLRLRRSSSIKIEELT